MVNDGPAVRQQVAADGRLVPSHVPSTHRAEASRLVDTLTERERAVLTRVARGLTNHEIAEELHVGDTTVKTFAQNVFGKLGVDNRATAAVIADRAGLV